MEKNLTEFEKKNEVKNEIIIVREKEEKFSLNSPPGNEKNKFEENDDTEIDKINEYNEIDAKNACSSPYERNVNCLKKIKRNIKNNYDIEIKDNDNDINSSNDESENNNKNNNENDSKNNHTFTYFEDKNNKIELHNNISNSSDKLNVESCHLSTFINDVKINENINILGKCLIDKSYGTIRFNYSNNLIEVYHMICLLNIFLKY